MLKGLHIKNMHSLVFHTKRNTKLSLWQMKKACCDRAAVFFPLNVIFNPCYFLAMFSFCSYYVKHAHNTYTKAIPEWRTLCTRGLIYYTELTVPRTITVSLSNRLKMASWSVYEQTHKQCSDCGWFRHNWHCTGDNLGPGRHNQPSPKWILT